MHVYLNCMLISTAENIYRADATSDTGFDSDLVAVRIRQQCDVFIELFDSRVLSVDPAPSHLPLHHSVTLQVHLWICILW
jgi:hypothetical protein